MITTAQVDIICYQASSYQVQYYVPGTRYLFDPIDPTTIRMQAIQPSAACASINENKIDQCNHLFFSETRAPHTTSPPPDVETP